jgi:uncharacterized protein (TIGR02391 family)
MTAFPAFEEPILESLCNILGHTEQGLTGKEISTLLDMCNISDPDPFQTKRHRLFLALQQKQREDGCGNNVIAFIQAALSPVRFIGKQEEFDNLRIELNEALAFAGYTMGEDGKLQQREKACSLTSAEERAKKLWRDLDRRGVHTDVLRFCRKELLQDNYFHAVFEATKSVADKIRDISGLTGDGSQLVDEVFGLGRTNIPLLAFNTLETVTEQNEQKGLMNLMKGLFGAFRNTTAHVPKIKWVITEQDALDILSLASLIHRRLDSCVKTR